MFKPRIRVAAAVVAALGAVALTGCGYDQGPPGTVVDKDRDYYASTKSWDYDLTVRTKDGKEVEFDVSSDDYDDCYRGSAYPRCTER